MWPTSEDTGGCLGSAFFLGLLFGLLRRWLWCTLLLLVHDESCVALLTVPLETCEVWCLELVVGLV